MNATVKPSPFPGFSLPLLTKGVDLNHSARRQNASRRLADCYPWVGYHIFCLRLRSFRKLTSHVRTHFGPGAYRFHGFSSTFLFASEPNDLSDRMGCLIPSTIGFISLLKKSFVQAPVMRCLPCPKDSFLRPQQWPRQNRLIPGLRQRPSSSCAFLF